MHLVQITVVFKYNIKLDNNFTQSQIGIVRLFWVFMTDDRQPLGQPSHDHPAIDCSVQIAI